MNRTIARIAGESRYLTFDFTADLDADEEITAVTWTPEAGVSLVAGTSAISSDGKSVSAKFSTATAGKYRVDAAITTTAPTETIIDYVIINVASLPVV